MQLEFQLSTWSQDQFYQFACVHHVPGADPEAATDSRATATDVRPAPGTLTDGIPMGAEDLSLVAEPRAAGIGHSLRAPLK